jgi:hypothetical protein
VSGHRAWCLCVLLVLPLAATPAESRPWSAGVAVGVATTDPHLGDYQWEVQPRIAIAGTVWRRTELADLGVRVTGAATHQRLAGEIPDPRVTQWSAEAVLRRPVLARGGFALHALASGGWTRFAWSPDAATFPTIGGPVTAAFPPIVEWSGGLGVAMTQETAGPWRVELELDHRIHPLDTAHRAGDAVVRDRERFGSWGARVGVQRALGRR